MASSSQSEDLLDVEQITLQEASLPPPIQRVMDPGQCLVERERCVVAVIHHETPHDESFPDFEVTAMTPEPSDLMDKLDLSTSSIDMTNTSLAVQEEKESELSGVGE